MSILHPSPTLPLKKRAVDACRLRKHIMDEFRMSEDKKVGISYCLICNLYVQIDAAPPPNGISIGGPALAKDCTRKQTKTILKSPPKEFVATKHTFSQTNRG